VEGAEVVNGVINRPDRGALKSSARELHLYGRTTFPNGIYKPPRSLQKSICSKVRVTRIKNLTMNNIVNLLIGLFKITGKELLYTCVYEKFSVCLTIFRI
jgi:hypothetical protein